MSAPEQSEKTVVLVEGETFNLLGPITGACLIQGIEVDLILEHGSSARITGPCKVTTGPGDRITIER